MGRGHDADGDGIDDNLEIDIDVSTEMGGDHHVSFDLTSGGALVAGGFGTGQVEPGAGTVTVTLPLEELTVAGTGGPLQVTDVLLTRGVNHGWVDRTDSLGSLDAVPAESLGGDMLAVNRPSAAPTDSDIDGFYVLLEWLWTARVPADGDYLVSGLLLSPDGQRIEAFETSAALNQGVIELGPAFDGSTVGNAGDGYYVLTGLTLASMTDPTNGG